MTVTRDDVTIIIESESRKSVAVSKCVHGIYLTPGDTKSWGCVQCYPNGHEGAETPVFPESSGDPLGRDDARTYCTCGALRLYYTPTCLHCGAAFPEKELRGQRLACNRRVEGICPACGSTIHYETKKKSRWQCADCDTEYSAPRLKGGEDEVA